MDWIDEKLKGFESAGLRRRLTYLESADAARITVGGREYLNFSSNNYLDLATEPAVVAAAQEAAARWGAGSGSSRLLVGSLPIHRELEEELARFKETESALVYPTGLQTSLGLITSLAGKGDRVILEREVHASLVDGARLSGAGIKVFRREKIAALEHLLSKPHNGRTLVVVDGVYSMSGEIIDLSAVHALCEKGDALLLVDDAHATGVIGPQGRGTPACFGLSRSGRIIQMGTLSKALGAQGGFVCASHAVIDLLVNTSRSFIYTTGLAPASAGAALAALRLAAGDEGDSRRRHLADLSRRLHHILTEKGFTVTGGAAPIISVIAGPNERALKWAEELTEAGFWVRAIRPPTVPKNTARIRLSVTAGHTLENIESLAKALCAIGARDKVVR